MQFEYDLEVCGYTGRLIDDHVFKTEKKAREYLRDTYGGDGGLFIELFKRDVNSGQRVKVEI